MQIPILKIDKTLPHHYLIGVAIKSIKSKDAGQFYLKYGPIHYTNDDVKKMANVVARCTDKLYKQSQEEAANAEECTELISLISAMKLSCSINDCTLHHFSSSEKLNYEHFTLLVKLSNTSKSSKEKLMEAKI